MGEQSKKGVDVSNVQLDENGKFELEDKELDEVAGGVASALITKNQTVFVGCIPGSKPLVRYGCA